MGCCKSSLRDSITPEFSLSSINLESFISKYENSRSMYSHPSLYNKTPYVYGDHPSFSSSY